MTSTDTMSSLADASIPLIVDWRRFGRLGRRFDRARGRCRQWGDGRRDLRRARPRRPGRLQACVPHQLSIEAVRRAIPPVTVKVGGDRARGRPGRRAPERRYFLGPERPAPEAENHRCHQDARTSAHDGDRVSSGRKRASHPDVSWRPGDATRPLVLGVCSRRPSGLVFFGRVDSLKEP